MNISHIDAYPILDSRGNPTVEAEVRLEDGSIGRGLAPSEPPRANLRLWNYGQHPHVTSEIVIARWKTSA